MAIMETKISGISRVNAIIASVTVVSAAMSMGMATFFIEKVAWVDALIILTGPILGVVGGIALFLQARWALIAAMIFYFLQIFSIKLDWLQFQFFSGVAFWLNYDGVGFNFVAVAMLILCLIEYKARRNTR